MAPPKTSSDNVYYYLPSASKDANGNKYTMPLTPPPKWAISVPTAPMTYSTAPATPLGNSPDMLPPTYSSKWELVWTTLQLVPFLFLNGLLGIGSFALVLTGVLLSVLLLPLCGLGIPVYRVFLQLIRAWAVMDIALANTITPMEHKMLCDISDDVHDSAVATHLHWRISPQLAHFTWKSTWAVAYFGIVKFAVAITSLVVLEAPVMPIVSLNLYSSTDSDDEWIAGFPAGSLNMDNNPVLYVLACVVYFVVGVFLMHVVSRLSRALTRHVCCQRLNKDIV